MPWDNADIVLDQRRNKLHLYYTIRNMIMIEYTCSVQHKTKLRRKISGTMTCKTPSVEEGNLVQTYQRKPPSKIRTMEVENVPHKV